MSVYLGGIEAGGTSFAISLAIDSPTNVVKQVSIPTTTPEETIQRAAELLASWNVNSIGIASFGPIDMNIESPTYGYITSTPKPNWANVDLVGGVKENLEKLGYPSVPIAFNTDVNAAALAEIRHGGHFPPNTPGSLCYITVGTGIGVGVYVEGTPVSGLLHPEAGHILIRRAANDEYKGGCPFHQDCLEGMANSSAVATRFNVSPSVLAECAKRTDAEAETIWDHEAFYLAQLCHSLILICSPKIIIIGGGLGKNEKLFTSIRSYCLKLLNGYIQAPELENMDSMAKYILASKFNARDSNTTSGAVGALCLALDVMSK